MTPNRAITISGQWKSNVVASVIFSQEEVDAINRGVKTQFRRPIVPQPARLYFTLREVPHLVCPYGDIGSILSVRSDGDMNLLLEIESVRAERVQEITENDAYREGVEPYEGMSPAGSKHKMAFGINWDGGYSGTEFAWVNNPYVFAVTFKEHKEGDDE